MVSSLAQPALPLPRGPVLGWASFVGSRTVALPSVDRLPHVAMTSSGRAAIYQALRQLSLPGDSKVLVPTYHCPTMVAPVLLAGLQPVFYAVRNDGLPDMESLSKTEAKNARAILVAHYFGLGRSLYELRSWCDEHGVALIEDCAHAFFGMAGERPVGGWGDYATASLSKFFPISEGGLLASAQNPSHNLVLMPQSIKAVLKGWLDAVETGVAYQRFRGLNTVLGALFQIKNHGQPIFKIPPSNGDTVDGSATVILENGYMSRIAQAPLPIARWLFHALPRAPIITRRRENYLNYSKHFLAAGMQPLFPNLPPESVPYVFPVLFEQADEVYAGLRAEGIPVFRWDRVWPGTPCIAGDHGSGWSRRLLQFLCHQDLNSADIYYIVKRTCVLANADCKKPT